MKRLIATIAIATTIVIGASVQAYQVCSTAMQVTFKNGTNIVLDLETGLDIY